MRGVRIEAWRSKRGPAQCHRCQQFRHSSHQCHRPLACVRCGEGHAARECPRPKTEPATCANCAGAHPACSSACPVFQREAKNRRAGTVAITRQQRRPATNAEDHEAPSATLMAAANGPARKDAPATGRRKKKSRKRGGRKGGKPESPTPPLQDDPAPAQAQAVKGPTTVPTDAAAGAGIKRDRQASKPAQAAQVPEATRAAPTTATGARTQQRRHVPDTAGTPIDECRKKKLTACAVKLSMDLIRAISQGQDIQDLVLDGLQTLLSICSE